MFKEKILPLEQCVKVGGNKYGKPTECCGTSFPNMIPKQQVQIQKKNKSFQNFHQFSLIPLFQGKQCCGYRPFDSTTRQCCSGNKIRPEC